ncbi:serine/threonine-protein phosphatase 5 [Salpingoeca rosetta]|uniref:protein-serine/threonine phosphatase n=1 Tax=Salpingoeca rosetta (strain ATCC 50818 / BSB-021) TaxID=946362 RepID=F2TYQ3_SALR5|nr:serine/threonine-protein phosphatase 5 [Salpingoeca rosetta]EGD78727.1 serine/threonine-protein phosphatase 5 [Salpingoeca rosetta]|eukprot:XP_004997684.1 serine/threonine-protein phosphatase 5 [Salpingoeca rosetta]
MATPAEEAKAKGNECFKKKQFHEAIEHYTAAIELDPSVPAYYTNRAFAYIKTEGFGAALEDADSALRRNPKFVKAYYRRATANMGLGKWKASKRDFEAVLKVRPNDKDAQKKFKEVDKIVRRLAFEKAITVGEAGVKRDVVQIMTEAMEKMEVKDSYDGPRLDGDITPEFMEELMQHLKDQKKLHIKYAVKILLEVHKLLSSLPSLVDITIEEDGKMTVCGDVHGQFYDVLNIFELNGLPSPSNPYLFNGDFVDRGSFSVEVMLTFFGFRILYPNHFFLSRGNHESINMNQMYGFFGEVKAKYTDDLADLFTEVFNWLPLGHLIDNKIFCVHGGLFSEDGVKVDQLRTIKRNCQPPDHGLMCEMLWSDPQPMPGRAPSLRGVGTRFGPDITAAFLDDNDLKLVIRSHEMKEEGYEIAHDGKCITIFSAPNYCDSMGNKGAFIKLDKRHEPEIVQFEAVPHPDVKPMAFAGGLSSLLGF